MGILVDPEVGILVDPNEGKSPITMRGLENTIRCELWDLLEESTNMWIWRRETDFLPIMSSNYLILNMQVQEFKKVMGLLLNPKLIFSM